MRISSVTLRNQKPCLVFVLMLGALAGCSRSLDSEQAERFQAAQRAFDEAAKPEQFVKAAAMYQELLDPPNNLASGELYFDLGNAWMKAKQSGRAIAAYRQAERYLPRDPHLAENLREALRADPDANRPALETIVVWQNWLSYPEKFYLATAALAATIALGVLRLFVSRRLLQHLLWAGVGISVLCILSAAYDGWRFEYVKHGVTVESNVVARKGYAESYEPALTDDLAEGTEFRVLDRRSNWLFIRLSGGQEVWIPEKTATVY
jgi:tetratricopeptide (TPR) repeat protein